MKAGPNNKLKNKYCLNLSILETIDKRKEINNLLTDISREKV